MYGRFVFIVLVILAVLQSPRSADAVPASPELIAVSQPDKTSFKVRQWGDEHRSGFETEDGYAIIFDEAAKIWYYAEKAGDGALVPSSIKVGIDPLPVDHQKHLRPTPVLAPDTQPSTSTVPISTVKTLGKSVAAAVIPVSGTKNIPVILANFSDTQFTFTANDFYNLLFGTGTFSLKDYYREVSYNNLTVAAGSSGVIGPVTVSQNHNYYGQDISGVKDYYVADLVYEAVRAADAQINFAEYSQNGSCTVENVVIVHQGTGQEASPYSSDIWSKSWLLSIAKLADRMNTAYSGAYTTNDPCPFGGYMKVDKFTMQPEINSDGGMITVGVFAHEFGHVLGLPDLYDTNKVDTIVSNGVGLWSLMSAGNYGKVLRSGDRPTHLDAWNKYKLGWITPTIVSSTPITANISAASSTASVYQLLNGSPESGEYFLVENRQKTGFDSGLPGSGLLIWHVDGSVISANTANNAINNFQCYPPSNCATNHYGVSLVQADGIWSLEQPTPNWGDTGDAFPGSTNNFKFTTFSSPNSNLWGGVASNVNITNISASGPTMTATMVVVDCSYDVQITSFSTQANSDSGAIQLVTDPVCPWTASSNTSWLTISSAASGTGSAAISFKVGASVLNVARQGFITVAGKVYTVTQAASDMNANQYAILQNGNFEQGQTDWIEYSSENIDLVSVKNTPNAGFWAAGLGGRDQAYDMIRQTVSIPSGVATATLTFKYKVVTSETDGTVHDKMYVLLLDQYDKDNLLYNFGYLSNLSSSTYSQITLDLSPYKGKTLQLAFAAFTDSDNATSFLVDDVAISTTAAVSVSALPMKTLLASTSGQASINVTSTGSWTAVPDSPWVTVISGGSGTGAGTVTYSVSANTTTDLRKAAINIGDKAVVILQAGTSEQSLITNGGFESSALGWVKSSSGGYVVFTNSTVYPAQSGSYYAWLSGYNNANDYIYQKITIPATSTDTYLRYRHAVYTSETSTTTASDVQYVYLTDPVTGQVITVFKSYSNLSPKGSWYESDLFDLSPYRGKSVNLVFSGVTNSTSPTSFLVDSVEVRSFTDTIQPVVTSVTPLENSVIDAVGSSITVTLSKHINPDTVSSASFSVSNGSSTVAGYTVYDSATKTMKFRPSVPIGFGKTYTVAVTNGIKDLSGNSLTPKNWTFSTVNMGRGGGSSLTISDALKVLQAVVGITPLSTPEQIRYDVAPLAADGTPLGNGIIDSSDVILILRRSIGIGSW